MPERPHHVERTCVVCRKQRHDDELLGLGLMDRCILLRPKSGRRAYVCVQHDCLAGLTGKILSRAFDAPADFDAGQFLDQLRTFAAERILATLGLARRVGDLDVGADRVLQDRSPDRFAVVANDLAPRTLHHATRSGAHVFADREALGRATGIAGAGVLAIKPGRLAQDAHYYMRLWQGGATPTHANITT